ncbi:uncharacterized protein LOC129548330 [Moschus berezovskii]|uniref:uncharacterized protein LOC129548330 n=1 Tax=Moschus berezovskii TaxID=68408 RepID=UPI00244450C5|nr:uncharacterized protein LOC129548330 [Moschus berezovskii]
MHPIKVQKQPGARSGSAFPPPAFPPPPDCGFNRSLGRRPRRRRRLQLRKVGERLRRAPPPARRVPGAQVLFRWPGPGRPSGASWRASPALSPRRQQATKSAFGWEGLRGRPWGQRRAWCPRRQPASEGRRRSPRARGASGRGSPRSPRTINGASMNRRGGPGLLQTRKVIWAGA